MGSYLAFCVKACAGGALALCLVLIPATGPAPALRVAPAPAPSQPAISQYSSAQATSLIASARTLEPYLVRQPNGTLTLSAPVSVVNRLPAADVQALGTGLNALNVQIAAGELKTTVAGAVVDPKTDRLTFQGGWSGYGHDWWHSWLCLNHNDVVILNSGWWWDLSTAGLAALAIFANVLGLVIGVVVYAYKAWISAADHGNGSCLNFGHWTWPNVWVTSQ